VTGEGGPLTDEAAALGMDVVLEQSLVPTLSPRSDPVALRRLTGLCRERSFDVVHTHSAKAGALGRMAAHRAGVPLIAHTYHGFPFHNFQNPVERAAYVVAERKLAAVTDVVFAVGAGVAVEALRRRLARPEALITVAPAVESRVVLRSDATRDRARARLGIDAPGPLVGTVGRVDYQKAPEHFVEAIRRLRHADASAVWIGGGPLLETVRSSVARAGMADRVRFVGERHDVADLLPALDVFAMSSRYEGLPCAVVEAMRCGLPVVATAVNSVPDLVVPGVSGLLVQPGRPPALADAIDSMLDDPVGACEMAARGQQLAGADFDAARLSAVLERAYTRGLGLPTLQGVA
jgi:glycosyltransferase involved in cell wall biosynthesis